MSKQERPFYRIQNLDKFTEEPEEENEEEENPEINTTIPHN